MKEKESKNRKPKEHEHEGPEAEEVRGTVVQYLLDPRGEVEGLLLDDGIFIKTVVLLNYSRDPVYYLRDRVTMLVATATRGSKLKTLIPVSI